MTRTLFAVLVLSLSACGASAESRGGPLAHHFESRYIAPIAADQKEPLLTAQETLHRAEMAHDHAAAEVAEVEVEVEVAQNEVDQAELAVKSCKSRKFAAEKCYDTPRIDATTGDLAAAQQDLEIARARLVYVEARRDYLFAQRDYLRQAQYVAEAELELERARLAENNEIRPPGPTVDDFARQRDERAQYAREMDAEADRREQVMEARRAAWERLAPAAVPAGDTVEPAPQAG